MRNTMEYKGYIGSVEYSEDEALFYGEVLGIRSLISYEGADEESLMADYHNAINDYLTLCKQEGITPEKTLFKQADYI